MNTYLSLILIAFLATVSFSFSDTNGIWTYAEDIRPGIFGDDEGVSNFTFNSVVHFNDDLVYKSTRLEDLFVNRSGDSMLGDLNLGGNNITNLDVLEGNKILLSSGAVESQMGIVFAEAYYTRNQGFNYYLRPANNSKVNSLEVINDLIYRGSSVDDIFINEEQPNSITSPMIQEGSIDVSKLDLTSIDTRYVNREGDTMTGSLDMSLNDINNARDVRANAFIYTSDKNLKENVANVNSKELLSNFSELNLKSYNYLNSSNKEFGLIAQNVKRYFPQVVFEDKTGNLGVDYVRLVPILIDIIQSQQNQIEKNTEEITQLKKLYQELKEE